MRPRRLPPVPLSFPENYDEDDGATAEDAGKELYDAMVESAQKLSMR